MQNDKALNVILYGRKFKKMTDRIYEKLRQEYDLKQIEVEILYYLSQRPEDSACDIYRNLYLNKGHVSQALSSLCKKGFLKASIDPDDRRYISYSIQKKGSNMIEETGRIKRQGRMAPSVLCRCHAVGIPADHLREKTGEHGRQNRQLAETFVVSSSGRMHGTG